MLRRQRLASAAIYSILISIAFLVAACTTPAPTKDIAAFTKAPKIETGNRSEHTGCEVKGSGAQNPCLADKKSDAQAVSRSSKSGGFAPWECETGPQAMAPVLGSMLTGRLTDLQNYCDEIERKQNSPSQSVAQSQNSSGSGSCENQYGGSPARHGQYICSNQGELLACQCSGGRCSLIHTGAIQCTRAGAVVD